MYGPSAHTCSGHCAQQLTQPRTQQLTQRYTQRRDPTPTALGVLHRAASDPVVGCLGPQGAGPGDPTPNTIGRTKGQCVVIFYDCLWQETCQYLFENLDSQLVSDTQYIWSPEQTLHLGR